jgi:hypothetical protein
MIYIPSTLHYIWLDIELDIANLEKTFRQKIQTVGIAFSRTYDRSPAARLHKFRPESRLSAKVTSLSIMLPDKEPKNCQT